MRRSILAAATVLGAGVLGAVLLSGSGSPAADTRPDGFAGGRLEMALDEVRRRAEAGDPAAEYLYGQRHERGDGVVQDLATAHLWYDRAAAHGWTDAVAARTRLVALMTPAQRTRTEDLARRRPSPVSSAKGPAPATRSKDASPASRSKDASPATGATAGADIADVQRRLSELGYRAGPADGKLGPQTRAALRAYQEDAGLPVTGELDRVMTSALLRGRTAVAPVPQTDSPGFHPNEDSLAEAGRLAGSVRDVQRELSRRGYWHGPRSGQLSPALRQAIAEYQADAGISPTGQLSELLLDHLRYARPEVTRQQAQAR